MTSVLEKSPTENTTVLGSNPEIEIGPAEATSDNTAPPGSSPGPPANEWTMHFSKTHGHHYWFNKKTGKSQWTHHNKLPRLSGPETTNPEVTNSEPDLIEARTVDTEDTVDNTVVLDSRPRSPKRPRLSFKVPYPEVNPDPFEEFVEIRTVGTQCTFPERVVMCVVCREEEATWVLVPCGHRCVCAKCFILTGVHACTSETLMEVGSRVPFHKDGKCPVCRTVVREVVTLYE